MKPAPAVNFNFSSVSVFILLEGLLGVSFLIFLFQKFDDLFHDAVSKSARRDLDVINVLQVIILFSRYSNNCFKNRTILLWKLFSQDLKSKYSS